MLQIAQSFAKDSNFINDSRWTESNDTYEIQVENSNFFLCSVFQPDFFCTVM